jgi:hypothetical protein
MLPQEHYKLEVPSLTMIGGKLSFFTPRYSFPARKKRFFGDKMLEVVTVRKDNISRLVAEYLIEGFMR